jgi:hypothetical protein
LIGALVLATGAAVAATTQVDLRILNDGKAVQNTQITLFFSCDKVQGVTDATGHVALEADCSAGFYWVEVDGRRIDELYRVDSRTSTIDLANVSFVEWQGGR